MPHARETIRDKVVTAVTGLATTGANVSSSRVYAFGTLPWINVFTLNEVIEEVTSGGTSTRQLSVMVEARDKTAADIDDNIDDICAEVETAVHADRTLGSTVENIQISATEIEIESGAEQLVAVAKMEFIVDYRVELTDPTTIVS